MHCENSDYNFTSMTKLSELCILREEMKFRFMFREFRHSILREEIGKEFHIIGPAKPFLFLKNEMLPSTCEIADREKVGRVFVYK